jgi:hypothetical protein
MVHHYYPHGSGNVGDELVAQAIRRRLARTFGPARFVGCPVNDAVRGDPRKFGLRGANLERTNAEADLVIIGGSNLLEPRKPRGDAGHDWGVFTDIESINRLRPPLLLLGMGTGSSFGKSIRPYSPRAAAEVRLLHERAFATAVRDRITVEELARIGVRTECTGCPVTFFTDREVTSAADRPLIVSFPPARIVKRFGGGQFMRGATRYLRDLSSSGVPLVITLHEPGDRPLAEAAAPRGVELFATERVDELAARYDDCCGVIGFRLHAALLGWGLGKPIVPVGVDWRGQAMIETFGLHDISIRPFRWGQFRKLRALTDRLLAGDASLIGRQRAIKAEYLRRHAAFLDRAAQAFRQLEPAARIDRRAPAAMDDRADTGRHAA